VIEIQSVKNSTHRISICAAYMDSSGVLTDPTSPTVDVVRVTPGTGARVAIAGSPFAMAKPNPPNLTGYAAVAIDINGLLAGQYECYVRGTVGGNSSGTLVTISISESLSNIEADTNETQGKLPAGSISGFDSGSDVVNLSAATETQIDNIQTKVTALPTSADVAGAVCDEALSGHVTVGTLGKALADILQVQVGRWKLDETTKQMIFYAADGTTALLTFNMLDAAGNPSDTVVYERVPV